nr:MAG TPA: hypothetical protein [Bacteriophage sp.]DAP31302.1 MAG TPA: hypothetical protein [Caudoviricetes sp.]
MINIFKISFAYLFTKIILYFYINKVLHFATKNSPPKKARYFLIQF